MATRDAAGSSAPRRGPSPRDGVVARAGRAGPRPDRADPAGAERVPPGAGRGALAEADAADRELAAGKRLPLLGAPVAVRTTRTWPEPTAFGCAGSSPCGARTRRRCAERCGRGSQLVEDLGETNTCELQWPAPHRGPAFGDTRNPWAPAHTPGGSCRWFGRGRRGGRLVPAALGSDGAGARRIPAAPHASGGASEPQRGRISATWPWAEAFHGIYGERHARPQRRGRGAAARRERAAAARPARPPADAGRGEPRGATRAGCGSPCRCACRSRPRRSG
ncbi:amidase family protein [Streptomyces sp. KL116D]|uniref:amidase family protein n=1 Tax=Streptomyces sp. KL116D TaxID=3045152 RepID=UPI00355674F2